MKEVYGVWRIWYDCDGYECSSLNSLFASLEKAEEFAKETTQKEVDEYLSCFSDEEIEDEYGKKRNEVTFDDLDEYVPSENNVDHYEVLPHEVIE